MQQCERERGRTKERRVRVKQIWGVKWKVIKKIFVRVRKSLQICTEKNTLWLLSSASSVRQVWTKGWTIIKREKGRKTVNTFSSRLRTRTFTGGKFYLHHCRQQKGPIHKTGLDGGREARVGPDCGWVEATRVGTRGLPKVDILSLGRKNPRFSTGGIQKLRICKLASQQVSGGGLTDCR